MSFGKELTFTNSLKITSSEYFYETPSPRANINPEAYCLSTVCAPKVKKKSSKNKSKYWFCPRLTTDGVLKEVHKSCSFCPDCGHALLWRK